MTEPRRKFRDLPPKAKALFLAYTAAFTAVALLLANFLLARFANLEPPTAPYIPNPYNDLYYPNEKLWTVLRAGTQLTPPLGHHSEFKEKWLESGGRYRIDVNAEGFRDRPFDLAKGDKFRIVAMGDSNTFGWDVELEDAYPKVLEALLNEGLPEPVFQVVNAGVPGYTSFQGRIYLESRLLGLEPDLLIVGYGKNDHTDSCARPPHHFCGYDDEAWLGALHARAKELEGREEGRSPWRIIDTTYPPGSEEAELKGSALYKFTKKQVILAKRGVFGAESDPVALPKAMVPRVGVADYEANLGAMARAAEARGIAVIFLSAAITDPQYKAALERTALARKSELIEVRPLLEAQLQYLLHAPKFERYRAFYRGLLGAETMDGSLDRYLYYSTDAGHPNAIGHHVLAEWIYLTHAVRDAALGALESRGAAPGVLARFHLRVGRLLTAYRRVQESLEEFDKATALDPELRASAPAPEETEAPARSPEVTRELVTQFIQKGETYLRTRDFASAAAEFRRARELDPDHAGAALALAHAVEELGDLAEAERLFAQELARDPACADCVCSLAQNLENQGRKAEAVATWRECAR
ncbi:MAG: tetratricopeptide repeat protein, partial [Candidatus Methylomirabilis sp.]|nr:tetratricopeptide repeat protein [Deltaproteobacteria bacterium]